MEGIELIDIPVLLISAKNMQIYMYTQISTKRGKDKERQTKRVMVHFNSLSKTLTEIPAITMLTQRR